MNEILIIGGGPAGLTAAIYAGRAGLKPVVAAGSQPGGQLMTTLAVDNFPGFPEGVSGPGLIEAMQGQAKRFGAVFLDDDVVGVDFSDPARKRARFSDGSWIEAKSVVVASGAKARWLGIPGEEEHVGRGVSSCATCDGFFFRGLDVAVIGGGNVAVEDAIHLAGMAKSVTLVHRRGELRAERILVERLLGHVNVRLVLHAIATEVVGDASGVTGLRIRNAAGEVPEGFAVEDGSLLDVAGVFVAIGHDPATTFIADALRADIDRSTGYANAGHGGAVSVKTSVPGVFVAGDVMDPEYRQAVTSAGFGCMAALEAERWLASRG